LNKQLLECRQIMKVLITTFTDPAAKPGWRNHPAVRMWAGYEGTLLSYSSYVAAELNNRDIAFENNWNAILDNFWNSGIHMESIAAIPNWWADPVQADKIITTHRASLFKKDPQHYAQWMYESHWVDSHRDAAVCCERCTTYWPTHKEA
jgi:hypothetical protein